MDGTKTWLRGGERIPPVLVLTLAVGATFGALGWLFTAFDGGVSGVTWLRVAAAGAGALLTVYLWALFAHRLRRRR